ncbi:hypothetical protein ASC64_14485 [Nocardioides sp. Root122]|nr:hypothetical protein ASC64_14485 [Nocardioides sp. Root122]
MLPLNACGSSTEETEASESTSSVRSSNGESTDTQEADVSEESAEVEALPFNASGLLGGNAKPDLPTGDEGEVSVIQVGPLLKDSGILLFAFRNNTSEAISHVDWTASARSGGSLVSSGTSQGTIPAQVASGEVGLAYIYFDNAEAIAAKTEYEFSADSMEADTSSYNTAPLKLTEANLVGDAIVGGAVNDTGAAVTGPYSVAIYCFDGNKLVDYVSDFAEPDRDLEDGDTVTFAADLYGGKCATYAIGVDGYFS